MNKVKGNMARENGGKHSLVTLVWVLLTITVFVVILSTILTTLL